MKAKIREPIMEALGLARFQRDMQAALAKIAPPLLRCQCCWEMRHVARDTYGGVATLCARCDYQVRATGCCHLHNGPTFYSELYKPQAVPSPFEIEALFYVKESERPKYDPAELADADV